MTLTSGGWITFWVFVAVLVLLIAATITFAVQHARARSLFDAKDIAAFTCGLVAFVALIIVAAFIATGVTNTRAKHDLESLGFRVVSVATDSSKATIIQNGAPRNVMIYKSPQTDKYTAYLLCEYGAQPQQAIDDCIVQP